MNSQAIGTGPKVSDSATKGAGQRVSQLREKAATAEQRALSAAGPIERAFYKAESASYQSLALEVEKLGQIAERIDATTAAILRESASVLSRFTQTPDDRNVGRIKAPANLLGDEKKIPEIVWQGGASPDVPAAHNAESRYAVQADALIDQSQLLESQEGQTAEPIDVETAAIVNETPSLVEREKIIEERESLEAAAAEVPDAGALHGAKAGSANDESQVLEIQKLPGMVDSPDAPTSAVSSETAPQLTNEKVPPNYHYVAHIDAPWDFFRGDEKISEEEWRRDAPANQVASVPSGATRLHHTRAARERVLISVRQARSLKDNGSDS